mgnify:FL=1
MTVTQIVEISKNRSKVYIDQELSFVLYKGELRLYGVRQGEALAGEDYQRIMEEVLPRRAKLRAMNLLKNREYTTARLREKLREGFYPEQVIDQAMEYVSSFRYTDDVRYAVDFITCHEKDRSRRRIEQDLAGRGIDRATMEKAWKEWESKGGEQDEQAMIRRLLEKKRYDPETADYREKQRIYAFLGRKGFSGEQISKVMRSFPELDME